jgi:hypothetical protein
VDTFDPRRHWNFYSLRATNKDMNIGLPEIGILAVLALFFIGGSRKKKKDSQTQIAKDKSQKDIMANYQNINSDYDNIPTKKSNPPKGYPKEV